MAESIPITSIDIETNVAESEMSNIQEKAHLFVDKVLKDKVSPFKAAKEIGTSLERIQSSEEMKAAITNLLDMATVAPQIQEKIIRAGRLKIFMDSIDSDPKVALEASKQIAGDLGMGTGDTPAVQINLGTDLKNTIKGLTLENIGPPLIESRASEETPR